MSVHSHADYTLVYGPADGERICGQAIALKEFAEYETKQMVAVARP